MKNCDFLSIFRKNKFQTRTTINYWNTRQIEWLQLLPVSVAFYSLCRFRRLLIAISWVSPYFSLGCLRFNKQRYTAFYSVSLSVFIYWSRSIFVLLKAKNLSRQFVFPVCCLTKTNLRQANWINVLLINYKIKLNIRENRFGAMFQYNIRQVKQIFISFLNGYGTFVDLYLFLSWTFAFLSKYLTAKSTLFSAEIQLNQSINWPTLNTLLRSLVSFSNHFSCCGCKVQKLIKMVD